jgi:hypothetical protein
MAGDDHVRSATPAACGAGYTTAVLGLRKP